MRLLPDQPLSFQKHRYVRSAPLMAAYRLLPCQHCGQGNACGAHSNWGWGKGMGIKADDDRCASLCPACHHSIDQGSFLTDVQRKDLWWVAHVKTVTKLLKLKLWPRSIKAPQLVRPAWL